MGFQKLVFHSRSPKKTCVDCVLQKCKMSQDLTATSATACRNEGAGQPSHSQKLVQRNLVIRTWCEGRDPIPSLTFAFKSAAHSRNVKLPCSTWGYLLASLVYTCLDFPISGSVGQGKLLELHPGEMDPNSGARNLWKAV